MDDATGQLGGNGTEISDLVPRKNGVRFAISKMSELPPRGGNSDIDTVYFTLPYFPLRKCCLTYSAVIETLSFNKSQTVPVNNTFPPYLPAPSPISIIQSACAITSRLCSMTIKVLLFSTKLFIKSNSFSVSLGCSPVLGSSRTIILLECFNSLVNLRRCLSPPEKLSNRCPKVR